MPYRGHSNALPLSWFYCFMNTDRRSHFLRLGPLSREISTTVFVKYFDRIASMVSLTLSRLRCWFSACGFHSTFQQALASIILFCGLKSYLRPWMLTRSGSLLKIRASSPIPYLNERYRTLRVNASSHLTKTSLKRCTDLEKSKNY